jgi:hypothetical protein
MSTSRNTWWLIGLCLGLLLQSGKVLAACNPSPGTVITKENWEQYNDCFSDGVQAFWQGTYFWKMPDDVAIHVGPQHTFVLPRPYVEATEKYGSQTRLVKQADGRFKLDNYVAGLPFPDPSGADKGTEIAANITYRMGGYLVAGGIDSAMRHRSIRRTVSAAGRRSLSTMTTGSSLITGRLTKACHARNHSPAAPGTASG